MYDVFGSIKSLLKIDSVSIDNNIFRLHYKATMFCLVAFSLLVTQKQYFGDPIDCIVDKIPSDLMDTYCWIHSTFTVPSLNNAKIGVEVPHPGIGNPDKEAGEEVKYHKYYQWVTLVLYFQVRYSNYLLFKPVRKIYNEQMSERLGLKLRPQPI